MKKRTKRVVIATSASIAGMVLSTACGYGPPVGEPVEQGNFETSSSYESTYESSYESSNTDATSEDASSEDVSLDDAEIERIKDIESTPTVYGPPVSGK